jgi:hypothetical protein
MMTSPTTLAVTSPLIHTGDPNSVSIDVGDGVGLDGVSGEEAREA